MALQPKDLLNKPERWSMVMGSLFPNLSPEKLKWVITEKRGNILIFSVYYYHVIIGRYRAEIVNNHIKYEEYI